jgi:uncharacterized membrane protein YqiK
MFSQIKLVKYSPKSIAVIGDTKPIKDALQQLCGKWNQHLMINGERWMGWIFASKHQSAIETMLAELNEEGDVYNLVKENQMTERAERKQKRAERRAEKKRIAEKVERKLKRSERRAEKQRILEEDEQKITDEQRIFGLSGMMWMIVFLIIISNYIFTSNTGKEMILV